MQLTKENAKGKKMGTVNDRILPTHTCTRCGHTWIPRKDGKPAECPACKSRNWDK
jgi:predicted Zn-ribbon and HTH transcriptional regulator